MKLVKILNDVVLDKSNKLLNEYTIFNYDKVVDYDDKVEYMFDANEIPYKVTIWHDSRTMNFGEYEVEFSVAEQDHSGYETKRDLKHLNSVIYTVFEIVERVVEEKNIKFIKVEGAGGRRDQSDDAFAGLRSTTRSRMYERFIINRYGRDSVTVTGRYIYIDMTKVKPDLFADRDTKSRKEELLDLLVQISDEDPDRDAISRGINGASDSEFFASTDFILNSELGGIFMEIEISDQFNTYSLEYEVFDTGDSDSRSFDSFEELTIFLKDKFL